MDFNRQTYTSLLEQAAVNPRLRHATDLRTSPADGSQRMLNALMPGTQVPIHRHSATAETFILLHGELDAVYTDEQGVETSRRTLHAGEGMQIPVGQFHTIEVHIPSVLFEAKDGAYAPLPAEDIISC